MHNHCHCEHKLKHCGVCDVVFCGTCKKEWKVQSNYLTWQGGSSITNTPYVTCTTGGTTVNTNSTLTTESNHNHQ